MEPILNIAMNAARRAGQVITRNLDKLDTLVVEAKDHHDFVTEVDLLAERMIIDTIQKAYPDHGILGEESGAIEGLQNEITWIIDPLDGTTNYIHGLPHFAVSIAVKIKNRIEYGLVYDPIRQEFFTAARGNGTRLNESRRLRVSSCKVLDDAILGTGFIRKTQRAVEQHKTMLNELITRHVFLRHSGAATLDLAYIAAGRLDGYWETSLKPWDMAAGALLIKEAGGLVSDAMGTEDYLETGSIVAANPALFKILLPMVRAAMVNPSA